MHDPFPLLPPTILQRAIEPLANFLSLSTLPLHAHELIFFALFYTFVFSWASPALSPRFSQTYASLSKRTKINWHAHVVSQVQCLLVCSLAGWVIWNTREERTNSDWRRRLWGYDGATGMVQAAAGGYFLWDLGVSALYVEIMGVSALLHAIAALTVTLVGFRPFANHYGLSFILYELSTPFLNIHWFLDKLSLTGSTFQLYNGILLLVSFFLARLVWGSYTSLLIYHDLWTAWRTHPSLLSACRGTLESNLKMAGELGKEFARRMSEDYVVKGDVGSLRGWWEVPITCRRLPGWLALSYAAVNSLLWALNVFWFWKMVGAVRKRFDGNGAAKKRQAEGKQNGEKKEQ